MENNGVVKYLAGMIYLLTIPFALFSQSLIYTGLAGSDGLNPGCHIVTPQTAGATGGVWYPTPINLNQPFDKRISFRIGPDFTPGIGDGMAFHFQNAGTAAPLTSGSSLGYVPSVGTQDLAIELDLESNAPLCEIGFHHVSIHTNGNLAVCSQGPLQTLGAGANTNNFICHEIHINWEPISQILTVEIDSIPKFLWNNNIIANVFLGNPNVYWGFAGSAGVIPALQKVCIDFIQAGVDTSLCRNDTLGLLSTGGFFTSSYNWSPFTNLNCSNCDNPTFTPPMSAQTAFGFEVRGSNFMGCVASDSVNVTVYNAPLFTLPADTHLCIGDTIQIVGPGIPAWTYTWTNAMFLTNGTISSPLAFPNVPTQFTMVATDPISLLNCSAADSILITIDTLPYANAGPNQIICDTFCTMNANSLSLGYSGLWSILTPGISASSATSPTSNTTNTGLGNYNLVWSVSNQFCNAKDTVNIACFGPLYPFAGNDTIVCVDSVVLNANSASAANGVWIDPTSTVSFSSPANPTTLATNFPQGISNLLWVVSNLNCTDTDYVNIDSRYSPVQVANDTSLCDTNWVLSATGSGIWNIFAGGGIMATPSNATTLVDSLPQGINRFVYGNSSGPCSFSDTLTLTIFNPQPANILLNNAALCSDSFYLWADSVLNGTGMWTQSPTTATITNTASHYTAVYGLLPGLHTFNWEILNGLCLSLDTFYVQVDTMVTAFAGKDTSGCGKLFPLQAVPIYNANGLWSIVSGLGNFIDDTLTNTQVDNLAFGLNQIAWTVQNGACIDSDTMEIFRAGTAVALAGNDTSLCDSDLFLSANQPNVGETAIWVLDSGNGWFSDSSFYASQFRAPGQGVVRLKWTVSDGLCQDSDYVSFQFFFPSTADAGPDQTIFQPSTNLGAASSYSGTGNWLVLSGTGVVLGLNDPNSPLTGIATGATVLEWVINNGPCPLTRDTLTITRIEALEVPEAFSPNNDGKNDLFVIKGIEFYPGNFLRIFNRWGNEIYQKESYLNEWNGNNTAGNGLSDDTYYYVLELPSGTTFQGFVVLKR